jgi:diguanylate cyclase (GGDEF)-like protein/PAS domain S-box-containing protein
VTTALSGPEGPGTGASNGSLAPLSARVYGHTHEDHVELRQSEARLQALLSSLDDLVFEIDDKGTYLGIWTTNDALLAAPRHELLGRTLTETFNSEIALKLNEIITHVLRTGCPEICELCLDVPAGRRWFQVRLAPIIGVEGGRKRVCLLTRDISEQKEAELEISRLLLREQLLSRLSQALPIGLFEIDLAGHIAFTNDRMKPILGEMSGATIATLMSATFAEDRPVLEAAFAMALGGEAVDDVEIKMSVRAADKSYGVLSERICSLSLRSLVDAVGAITGVVGCLSDVTERVQLRRELEVMASVDKLTSCLNRDASLLLLERTTGARKLPGEGNAVIFIDLDRFKLVNDRFGHAAGDLLLAETANRLRGAARNGDAVGRIGGDEFVVICPKVKSADQAVKIAERMAEATTATVDVGNGMAELHTSVGVAWTTEALDADAFIAQADYAMYQSKRTLHTGVTLFSAKGAGGAELQDAAVST